MFQKEIKVKFSFGIPVCDRDEFQSVFDDKTAAKGFEGSSSTQRAGRELSDPAFNLEPGSSDTYLLTRPFEFQIRTIPRNQRDRMNSKRITFL